ncbi:hypothetical protein F5Y15DRAFT_128102 [Xylariaceae sp. FL0016]|nr:hypothetical protein F5Y15DRAFT_128102 [Xylariaceae sp. FL0016]
MPPLPTYSLAIRTRATANIPSASSTIRLFTTTAARAQNRIPPESPLFINVPNPPQDQSVEARRDLKPVKGYIPVPRKIFSHRDSHLKPTTEWLDKASPAPTSAKALQEPRSELQAWKRKMAASRRANIRHGVTHLWDRKQRLDARRLAQRSAKLAANRAAAMAPEREDERLTRGFVNPGTLRTAVERDPQRFERQLASLARTSAIESTKSEARRDAIQGLYMSARSFIVDEADLEARVEKVFAPNYYIGSQASGRRVTNVWDMHGPPMAVKDMLNEISRSSSNVLKSAESEQDKTLKRQKRVAEELTGGKMDD